MTENSLDNFRRAISWELACGSLADVELTVTGDDGGFPVIAALDAELLSTVLGRLRAVGGCANLFVRGADGQFVWHLSSMTGALSRPRMTTCRQRGDRPNVPATVGLFLDYVEKNPNGVKISAAVGQPAWARDAQNIEFSGRP